MSSQKYASPLVLRPKTSRIFVSLFTVGHLGAMAVVIALNFSWMLKLVLFVVLMISLVSVIRKQGKASVDTLTWKDGGEWLLELNDGSQYETYLLPSSYISPWLVVLNFGKAENHRGRSITFFRDALDQESFRRLRVRLGINGETQ